MPKRRKRESPLWCLCIDCCSRFNGRPAEDIPNKSLRTIRQHCLDNKSSRYPQGTKHHRRSCQPEAEGLTTYPVRLKLALARFGGCLETAAAIRLPSLSFQDVLQEAVWDEQD